MTKTVRITEGQATREPVLAIARAMAARDRGDIVECPWWFTYIAMSQEKWRRGDKAAEVVNERIQEALR